MIIYWRPCEVEETLSFVPRWNNKPKLEILKKCWLALIAQVDKDDTIIVIEDKLSSELSYWLATTATCKIEFVSVKDVEGKSTNRREFPIHYITLVEEMDKQTKAYPNEIHYLCNDDILHLPHALNTLKSIYKDGWQGFATLYDYPDRYTLDKQYTATTRSCEIYLSSGSHWRTIPSCTGVTSALGITWQKYMRELKRNAFFNDDSYTWMAYAQVGCLSPIPGCATHLTENHMTPRVNWEQYYDSINI